ncbi:MAG: response regulator transcription factor [Bacteroidia bacterium]|nr:response regulator transcription factor [Bacteroidia bacterium]
MIRAIIVDDEAKSRTTLSALLTRHCTNVTVVQMADSVETALIAIEKNKPDVVFLDIEMPFASGFTLLEKIKNPDFGIIFCTAYDAYAIKAIKFSALDYLLKPVDVDELIAAVNKIEEKQKSTKRQTPDFELLLSNLKQKNNAGKIAVPTFDGLQMISVAEIIKCTASESYTQISLQNGTKIMVSRILKEYDDLLSEMNFFRVHNSCLINLAHVSKYVKGDGGYVVMTDGESVEVSRRKKAELLERLALVQ